MKRINQTTKIVDMKSIGKSFENRDLFIMEVRRLLRLTELLLYNLSLQSEFYTDQFTNSKFEVCKQECLSYLSSLQSYENKYFYHSAELFP